MTPIHQRLRTSSQIVLTIAGLTLCLAIFGCGSEKEGEPGFKTPKDFPYRTLSEYGFFQGNLSELTPVDDVIPYQVTAPLWADHAGKSRYIVLPEGEQMVADGPEDWLYPDGTVIIKTFFYSTDKRRMDETATPIETRLMIKEAEDWKGHTYIWNDTLTDAVRKVSGKRLQLSFVDEAGAATTQEYIVPNTNQCKDCHERDHLSRPLGLVSRQLNRPVERDGETVSQLDWLNEQQLFTQPLLPLESGHLVNPFGDAPLADRARAYLDANCSHCHRDGGNGGPSGLVLLAQETFPRAYGVCKGPVAAGDGTGGFYNDILPGHPEQSIIVHRMKSTDPEIKMPEIPNRLPHQPGIELISEWIRQMPEVSCD
jgi:uncharacterized repeat protein (TIGR03806 family)